MSQFLSVETLERVSIRKHDYGRSLGLGQTEDTLPKRCDPAVRRLGSRPWETGERILAPHGHLNILDCEMGIMRFRVL